VSETTPAPAAGPAPPANASDHVPPRAHRPTVRGEHVVVAYYVSAVAGLLVLRALVDSVDFLSVGWIIVLALVPLVPWLLPRVAFLGNP